MCQRMNGNVRWFDHARGFGFVVGDNGAEFFFHPANVRGGARPPADGSPVDFIPVRGPKGFVAVDVVAL